MSDPAPDPLAALCVQLGIEPEGVQGLSLTAMQHRDGTADIELQLLRVYRGATLAGQMTAVSAGWRAYDVTLTARDPAFTPRAKAPGNPSPQGTPA